MNVQVLIGEQRNKADGLNHKYKYIMQYFSYFRIALLHILITLRKRRRKSVYLGSSVSLLL